MAISGMGLTGLAAAFGQKTVAMQLASATRTRRAAPKRRRRAGSRKATPRTPTRRRASSARSSRAKLVKGSAAARRHMARLRAMRGRGRRK